MDNLIPEPYGGKLVDRTDLGRISLTEAKKLPKLSVPVDHIYDAQKIATGAYSPLKSFMTESEYTSVVTKNLLPNGLPWTIPIILAPDASYDTNQIKVGDTVTIPDLSGEPFCTLEVEETYRLNKSKLAESVYGTTDTAHPNVADLLGMSDIGLSGKLTMFRRLELPASEFERTPLETREHFRTMGWKNVAAYQARNPPHLAHEYIQRITLERDDIDAIFIQPVVGKLKKGDYKPEVIMRAYNEFTQAYYPKDRFFLSSLSISMRYAGPKAVLFYAIVRRNYGCSHYIVGRDQAGVGSYYDPYAGHRIFDQYDVGVHPIRYHETFYCKKCQMMVSDKICPHPAEYHMSTSQTLLRKLLAEGKPLPREIIRKEVADILERGEVIN